MQKGVDASSSAPPMNSLVLGEFEKHRIAWKPDGNEHNSELIFLVVACFSIFPTLPNKAIPAT